MNVFQKHLGELASHGLLNNLQQLVSRRFLMNYQSYLHVYLHARYHLKLISSFNLPVTKQIILVAVLLIPAGCKLLAFVNCLITSDFKVAKLWGPCDSSRAQPWHCLSYYKIYVAVNFCFSFVLNSLAYITIPKNNGKIKIN